MISKFAVVVIAFLLGLNLVSCGGPHELFGSWRKAELPEDEEHAAMTTRYVFGAKTLRVEATCSAGAKHAVVSFEVPVSYRTGVVDLEQDGSAANHSDESARWFSCEISLAKGTSRYEIKGSQLILHVDPLPITLTRE